MRGHQDLPLRIAERNVVWVRQFRCRPTFAGGSGAVCPGAGGPGLLEGRVLGRRRCSARNYDTARDEVSLYHQSLEQAQALTSLGAKPLVVLTTTAQIHKAPGWDVAQDEMARLSSNSSHRVVDTSHVGLLLTRVGYDASVRAIIGPFRPDGPAGPGPVDATSRTHVHTHHHHRDLSHPRGPQRCCRVLSGHLPTVAEPVRVGHSGCRFGKKAVAPARKACQVRAVLNAAAGRGCRTNCCQASGRAAQRHRHICAQAKPEGTPAVAARIYERRPRTEAGPLCWPSPPASRSLWLTYSTDTRAATRPLPRP